MFTKYFAKAFQAINKNIDLYLINAVFFIPYLFENLAPTQFKLPLNILTIPLFFVSIGYSLSMPLFFEKRFSKENLDYSEIIRISLRNAVRTILPFILFSIAVILIMFAVVSFVNLPGENDLVNTFNKYLEGLSYEGIILSLIQALIYSLLIFMPIFFSIKNIDLINSIQSSILFNLKHIKFTVVLIALNFFINITFRVIPADFTWNQLIIFPIFTYIGLIQTVMALLYYQDIK